MDHDDFLKIIGPSTDAEYVPVAFLLRSGYGVAGFYSARFNEGLDQTLALVNARVIELRDRADVPGIASITSFNEFIEEIVTRFYRQSDQGQRDDTALTCDDQLYGKSIPLATISFDEIAVMYPVARISDMMRQVRDDSVDQDGEGTVPTFLDFQNHSVVLKMLKTKLW